MPAVLLCTALFSLAFALQVVQTRYVSLIYWLLAVMVAIVGIMAADILHVVMGVPYALSTLGFAVVLGAIFLLWYRSEGSLSIHHVITRRRELFCWMTVCATVALGTAAGDLTAATLGLGYFVSGLLFLALFIAPAIGHRAFGLTGIFAFWFSYVMTLPLGASFADWAAKPIRMGGRGLGSGTVGIVLTIAIVALVGYLSVTGRDAEPSTGMMLAGVDGGEDGA